MIQINTREQAIEVVINSQPLPGETYARISNKQLLGIEDKKIRDKHKRMGLDLEAGGLRKKIEDELENTHGIGLIPEDFKGTYKVVSIDELATYKVAERARKTSKLLTETLEHTMLKYLTSPHISPESAKHLEGCKNAYEAIDQVVNVALLPILKKLEK